MEGWFPLSAQLQTAKSSPAAFMTSNSRHPVPVLEAWEITEGMRSTNTNFRFSAGLFQLLIKLIPRVFPEHLAKEIKEN